MADVSKKRYCCTTGVGLCFWGAAFLIFYGLGLAAIYSLHLGRYGLVVLFAALGLACVANFALNRTFHCLITGPFFLLVAAALALEARGVWSLGMRMVWPIVVIVVCVALLLERRFAS
jgi:hypothetical protein